MATSPLISELQNNYKKIIINTESSYVKELRKRVFVETQESAVIFTWFNMYYNIDLTEEEMQILKQLLSNYDEDSKEEIISIIFLNNISISEQYLISFVNLLPEEKRIRFYLKLIKYNRIDDEYKIYLSKILLNDETYKFELVSLIDEEINDSSSLWGKLIDIVVARINIGDKTSKQLAEFWSESTIFLDIYTRDNNIKSGLLYTYTHLEQYLPQIAVDTFLF